MGIKIGQPDKQSRIVFHNKWKTETTPGTVTEPAQTGVKTTTMMRTPKTDDIQRPAVYVVMIIAAAGIAIGVSLYRKYRKKRRTVNAKKRKHFPGRRLLADRAGASFSLHYKTFRDTERAHAQSFGL